MSHSDKNKKEARNRLGRRFYETRLKSHVEPGQNGQFVAIDLENEQYAVAPTPRMAMRPFSELPQGAFSLYLRKIGATTEYDPDEVLRTTSPSEITTYITTLIQQFCEKSNGYGKEGQELLHVGTAVIEPLCIVLRDGNETSKRKILPFLTLFTHSGIVEPICERLNDNSSHIRLLAALALVRLAQKRMLRQHAQYAEEKLLPALKDQSSAVRAAAAEALSYISEGNAVTPLCRKIADNNWYVRRSAAEGLGRIGDATAVKALCYALTDTARQREWKNDQGYWPVRDAAQLALWQINSPTAVDYLLKLLACPEENVRYRAAKLLSLRPDERAVEALCAALTDESCAVRVAAAESLGHQDDIKAIKPLYIALADTDAYVRTKSAEAIESLGTASTLPRKIIAASRLTPYDRICLLLTLNNIAYRDHERTLCYPIPDIRKLCKKYLTHDAPEVRAGSAEMLGYLELLRSTSQTNAEQEKELLRPTTDTPSNLSPEELLRAVASTPPENSPLWSRFRNRRR